MCGTIAIAATDLIDYIGDQPHTIACEACDAEIKENHKFCFECGAAIADKQ